MSQFNITLPSRGLLDGGKIPGGVINLKSLGTREESILFNPGGDTTIKFDSVLSGCIINSPIPVTDMLMTDRLYIMVALRSHSFGSKYRVPLRCSACRSQYTHEIDLSTDLHVKIYEDKADLKYSEEFANLIPIGKSHQEPFTFTLPDSKDEIEFRLLRGYDEKQIAVQSKRILMQSTDVSDPSFGLRLALMIHKVNGEELTPQRKHMYVESLEAKDELALSWEAEAHESGLDLDIQTSCRSCGYEEEVTLPFTADFFRPKRPK